MPDTYTLESLYDRLKEDAWRREPSNQFSQDVRLVNDILHHPFSREWQRAEAVASWLQRQQPCLFGRIAAAKDWLHYCILTDKDLRKPDQFVANKIRGAVLEWKRRSLYPAESRSVPAHGFVLLVASSRLALAEPDDSLYDFANRILELWDCPSTQESAGKVHWESLFLENPVDHSIIKFTFTVDFFAAQGDRRWWHDHRIPGGLAFTANSVGHMRRYREWYLGMTGQEEWVLKTAMSTIHLAAQTPYGKATWLKPLEHGGRPVIADIPSPFSDSKTLKAELTNRDWTRYGGFLHTDHSVRREFFESEPAPNPEIAGKEYMQDFTYLYNRRSKDHAPFITGIPVTRQEVDGALGRIEDWPAIARGARTIPYGPFQAASAEEEQGFLQVQGLLQQCQQWNLSTEELAGIA